MEEEYDDARWRKRFDHFSRAVPLVEEIIPRVRRDDLTVLERDGFIQRFEFTFELAWETMADYLEAQGVEPTNGGARSVIRNAVEVGLVEDGDGWMAALNDRNLSSHVYDEDRIKRIVAVIASDHVHLLVRLRDRLADEAAE